MKRLFFAIFCFLTVSSAFGASKSYKLDSPSGIISVDLTVGEDLQLSVSREGVTILEPSVISIELDDDTVFGAGEKARKVVRRSVDVMVDSPVYKKSSVRDRFNEMTLTFREFSLVVRAYDEGAAYRFVAAKKAPFKVAYEEVAFRFPSDCSGWIPYARKRDDSFECQFWTSFEREYTFNKLSEWLEGRIAFLPLTFEAADGMKVCITESDLVDYPGLYFKNDDKDTTLEAVFAPYPKEIEQGGHNMLQGLVKTREEFIAEASAKEKFPWRIVIVSKEDKDLLQSDMAWLLGAPADPSMDFSWVRPGKVAWDWWNAWNLYGVDFRTGVNNETYQYYIDFAAANGIEYVILDEGWAVKKKADLFQVVDDIDLPALVRYASQKGVGLILWAGYWAFEKDMERACREYAAMGIKGFKVDFMDRDDQPMVRFYERTARMAAKYHLIIDFHGAFKPAGLQRTWPNVINFEGVYGLENVKGNKSYMIDLVTYDVTIPFVRLVAGPADYTQGAMRNATKDNFRYVSAEAMSQGTRCRQLAEYVVFDAPLTMLCDSPSNYMREPECLKYIASVPTVWDEVRPLAGKVGEYVAVAKRKGDVWYVGALTGWDARELELDLSFLPAGSSLEIFRDGPNADRAACDYQRVVESLPAGGKYVAKMAPGGGWTAVVR